MTMLHKRWFQSLITLILIFLLILLISLTDFIFSPLLQYVGAVAIPLIAAAIIYYLTKQVMHLLEPIKISLPVTILPIFLLLCSIGILILIGFLIVTYIAPIAQKQFSNLIDNVPTMIQGVQDLISYWQANQTVIPEEVNQAIDKFTKNLQSYLENIMSYLFGFISQLIS